MDTNLNIESRDRLFRPSCWSKRFPSADQVLQEHLKFTKNESDRIKRTIPYETVNYGNVYQCETFDIYGTHLPKDAPIFVFIHGGYWQELNKNVSAYVVQPFIDAGHKVIVLDYDLCPNVTLEQLVEQVQRAGVFIANFAASLKSKGIQLCGHSAGAHLAVCLFDALSRKSNATIVKSLHLISGIYDLCEIRFMPTANPNNILSLDDTNWMTFSPNHFKYDEWTHLMPNITINLFIGTNDPPKLWEQSHDFHKLIQKYFKDCQFIELNGYDHFNIVEDLSKSEFSITKMIIDKALEF